MDPRLRPACLALVAFLGCTHTAPAADSAEKRVAPVAVEAVLTARRALVTLRFEAAATEVTCGVRGLDGLTVTAPAPLARHDFQLGETAVLEVPLTSAAGTLAVFVSGSFNGTPWSRAVTFAVGPRQGASDSGIVHTDQGPLEVLPGGK
jgi:hypothetical protein